MLHFFARRMKEAREDQRGFTLIELLVVVIIIGILAAIAIPTFLGQRQRAYDAQAQTTARNAATAAQTYYVDKQTYAGVDAPKLNAIETSLPATAGGAPYNGTGGVYTVADETTDFTITVKHPQGSKTFVFKKGGLQ